MSELSALFEKAQADVVQLNEAPDVQNKLKLYALFKQSTVGDVEGERPNAINFVAQAKYDAWVKVKGLSKEEAMQHYVDLVETLKAADTR
jgi:acyl-CoA-binding protein